MVWLIGKLVHWLIEQSAMSTLSIGNSAPAFSMSGVDGKSYGLNEGGARLTLAAFFKTTCPVCALEWLYLEKIHQAYKDAGLAVWGVSQHDRAASQNFASKHGSTFPILIDAGFRASHQYDPEVVPTLFLIDAANTIIERVASFDKAGLNRLSNAIAARLGVGASVIATDDDGNPPFRPG
ncbi:MAG: TlpA family protein disulfide reductase [Chloroflexi bacterium]|nr:TlpA family protein disulfide reductase [Chloroflexota bacterium]